MNTGKQAEKEFESIWARLGKRAYLHRLQDGAEVAGRTGQVGKVRPQPSDYLLVHDGQVEFAEVKSTEDTSAFRFSLLQRTQGGAALMILAAGGQYFVYVKSLVFDRWFKIPYDVIRNTKRASIPWRNLQEFEWNPPTPIV